ncbi:MAG: hypothetical protein L7T62_05425 [Flavobacteriaceae bacterium]|nr:hypothetical protein [Flavobacteriaceae bacterium]
MRYLLNILFWGFVAVLFYGFYHKSSVDYVEGEKWIGSAVLGLTFIYLPIFLVYRWKDKKLSDYTLTDDNFNKMKTKKTQNTENQ